MPPRGQVALEQKHLGEPCSSLLMLYGSGDGQPSRTGLSLQLFGSP